MRRLQSILILLFLLSVLLVNAQQSDKAIRKGNEYYKMKQYDQARNEFSKIAETDSLYETAQFNLANTLYRLGKKDEALKIFDRIQADVKDSGFLSNLSYNEGVVYSSENDLEESIDAYQKALLLNPQDQQARDNLQKALLELKKKNEPPEKKKQQPSPRMNPKDAANKLKQLEQKEKQVQQRVQNEKSSTAGSNPKDW
ncbi:MAG: tetratricopeptide repeat protein [Bacteroidetes bacterium]|nr:tetratricopeptide repeat protein [Bacteroidota bacterium]MBS1931563.1 tetratricopeptide repeat protein [Bacteroidota bacterium]